LERASTPLLPTAGGVSLEYGCNGMARRHPAAARTIPAVDPARHAAICSDADAAATRIRRQPLVRKT
jgi:hypothetical protein